jgi:hypothetical protein
LALKVLCMYPNHAKSRDPSLDHNHDTAGTILRVKLLPRRLHRHGCKNPSHGPEVRMEFTGVSRCKMQSPSTA